jgi:hypothetical protein
MAGKLGRRLRGSPRRGPAGGPGSTAAAARQVFSSRTGAASPVLVCELGHRPAAGFLLHLRDGERPLLPDALPPVAFPQAEYPVTRRGSRHALNTSQLQFALTVAVLFFQIKYRG